VAQNNLIPRKRRYRLQPPRLSEFLKQTFQLNLNRNPVTTKESRNPTKTHRSFSTGLPAIASTLTRSLLPFSPGLPEFPSLLLPPACTSPLSGVARGYSGPNQWPVGHWIPTGSLCIKLLDHRWINAGTWLFPLVLFESRFHRAPPQGSSGTPFPCTSLGFLALSHPPSSRALWLIFSFSFLSSPGTIRCPSFSDSDLGWYPRSVDARFTTRRARDAPELRVD
jgi:hypothetical protein